MVFRGGNGGVPLHSPSMITGAGGGSEYCGKMLGVAGSSIATWNTG